MLSASLARLPPWMRFLLVGGFNTALMYSLYALLVLAGVHYQIALVADYAAGMVLGFVLNRSWTFGSDGRISAQAQRYVAVYLGVYALNYALLHVTVEWVGLHELPAQALSVAIATIASYVAQRTLVFPKVRPPAP